mgnify:FL=1
MRVHGDLARIEISSEELVRVLDVKMFDELNKSFKDLGFRYITLDLEGFRSGSMSSIVAIRPKAENRKVELEKV